MTAAYDTFAETTTQVILSHLLLEAEPAAFEGEADADSSDPFEVVKILSNLATKFL